MITYSEFIESLNEAKRAKDRIKQRSQGKLVEKIRWMLINKRAVKGVDNFVLLTSDNSDGKTQGRDININKMKELIKDLQDNGYVFIHSLGRYGNEEMSLAVLNLSVEDAKQYCGLYEQESFIECHIDKDTHKLVATSYEKMFKGVRYEIDKNPYIKKNSVTEWQEEPRGKNDNFTLLGRCADKQFKFTFDNALFPDE